MFYLFEITTYTTDKPAYGCYPYDNETSAKATFHTKMGGAMKSANVKTEQLIIVSDDNTVIAAELYTADAE